MIDDKEIDFAARAQALSKHINETAYFQLRSIEDFKDGARWAINEFLKDLWHPISDKPEEHTDIIYIDEDKDFWDINNYDSNNFDDSFGKGWESACRTQDIYKWAYKDDLFPKKGGEQ